jgi:hypothetical protein
MWKNKLGTSLFVVDDMALKRCSLRASFAPKGITWQ